MTRKFDTVTIDTADGIAWVMLNRPDKKNAMSPQLNDDMARALDVVEADASVQVMVLGGHGGNFSAGMDLKEYFHEIDGQPPHVQARVRRSAAAWQYHRLRFFPKPTIAMAEGWCFGGAFTPLISCDIAIAAHDAQFGLSEINWGIIPAGVVTKALAQLVSQRDALYYIMTGETIDGRQAATMRLVNEAVPLKDLRARVKQLAEVLMSKNPTVLRAAKIAYRRVREMSYDDANDYLMAKNDQARFLDPEQGREQGLKQFLDEKSYRPGLGGYRRES